MTSGSPWRGNRGTTTTRRGLECWNVAPSIFPLFPLPRRLHRPNLCQGPGIAPCLWKNPRRATTSWWRTLWPLNALLSRNPRVPMSGVENHPCLVVESPKLTEGRAGTESPVPMSGTKDRPSLMDDSPVMPKVHNLCWGRGNPVEGGSATLRMNLVSPPTTISPMEGPQPRVLPNLGGRFQRLQRARSLFLLPIRESNHPWWFMSDHNILWWRSPHRDRRSLMLLVLFPFRRHPASRLTSST